MEKSFNALRRRSKRALHAHKRAMRGGKRATQNVSQGAISALAASVDMLVQLMLQGVDIQCRAENKLSVSAADVARVVDAQLLRPLGRPMISAHTGHGQYLPATVVGAYKAKKPALDVDALLQGRRKVYAPRPKPEVASQDTDSDSDSD